MVEERYKLFSQICSENQFMEVLSMIEITYHKEGDYFVPDLYLENVRKNPISENLKDTDILKWAGLMNNYKYSVEKIVYKELIYC